MIDRIQPKVPASHLSDMSRLEGKPEAARGGTRQTDNPAAEISLSEEALAMQRAMQAVKNTPDVRTDIVERIRNEIQAGTYKINVEALAGRLLSFLK